jgi:hypothetical protein
MAHGTEIRRLQSTGSSPTRTSHEYRAATGRLGDFAVRAVVADHLNAQTEHVTCD